jgi:NTP pyrophosphatase (non-canonical NTP hydrolase)
MTYYLYHIPGKKVGVTTDLKRRVEDQQGYGPGEYEIIESSDDIDFISEGEIIMQKAFGYKVDQIPYNKLNCNKNKLNMKINVTEQTTTFPCPVNKLKGQLMDNLGMTWHTDHGTFTINEYSIKWIMANIKTSMFNKQRSYIYNKAFARFYDNHQTHDYPSNGHTTRTGGLAPTGMKERSYECCDENNPCTCEPQFSKRINKYLEPSQFDLIREWADERGLYENGDTKTQALKLVEEVGETCRAILKEDFDEVIDGIGDCVVVLTNLAELQGVSIETCIDAAYQEIKNRKGKMVNGTYKKD